MSESCVVLLSGGQDSTTTLYWAKQEFASVHAVSVLYGQRHAVELDAAERVAQLAGVPRTVLHLPVLADIGDSALVNSVENIAGAGGYDDAEAPEGLPTSFVPGRNLLFLSMAAAVAVKLKAKNIVTGVCQTDYSGYPDCRRSFVDAFQQAATLAMPSSAGPIVVHTPLMFLTKRETVDMARKLPGCWEALALSVTCYEGQRPGCGKCPACALRAAGFTEAGVADPAA